MYVYVCIHVFAYKYTFACLLYGEYAFEDPTQSVQIIDMRIIVYLWIHLCIHDMCMHTFIAINVHAYYTGNMHSKIQREV